MAERSRCYVGRFAPSPTGPLHFGSLLTAVASYLDARANDGLWLVRIEDLDRPRVVPGAAERILETLARHGLEWDEAPLYQTSRLDAYAAGLGMLEALGEVFYCRCSRRDLRGHDVYPGTCRAVRSAPLYPHAVRVRVPSREVVFQDLVQGPCTQRIDRDVGDFVVRRRDGIFAYQLAVVIDDAWQRVTRIVRGADLLDNTPRQLFLAERLGYAPAAYAHVPIIVDRHARKLSKQTLASAVDERTATRNLCAALDLLGHAPPADLQRADPTTVLGWGRAHWQLDKVPKRPVLTRFVGL